MMNPIVTLSILLTGSLSLLGCRQALDAGQQQVAASPRTQVTAGAPKQAEYRKISAREAKAQLAQDRSIQLVDVRTEEEHRDRRIAHSLLIPDYDIETLAPTLLPDKDAKIILYCRSGRRSYGAAMKLVALGYTNVYDLGGINDWPYETISGK